MGSSYSSCDEEARVSKLKEYDILDTLPEEYFDHTLKMACEMTGAEVGYISFIDQHRQWFKAKKGFDIKFLSRENLICETTLQKKILTVFLGSENICKFNVGPFLGNANDIAFYTGVPLLSASGLAIGTLAVLSKTSISLNEIQKNVLQSLAFQAMSYLDLKKNIHMLILRNSEIKRVNETIAQQVSALNESAIVAFTNARGKITFVNNKFCEISGYTREELLGKDHRLVNSGFHPQNFFKDLWATISSGQTWRGQVRNRAKNGSFYWVNTTIVPCRNAQGEIYQYVAIRSDITEQKNSEAKLIQASKMSALGEMSGGVAHEINNPLAIISAKVENILYHYRENPHNKEVIERDLEKIQLTTNRIAKIVKGLRSFSRNSEKDPFLQTSLESIVADTVSMCREKFSTNGVQLNVGSLPQIEIECRGTQISQALVNLLNNAYDAVQDLPEKWIRLEGLVEKGTLILSVKIGRASCRERV